MIAFPHGVLYACRAPARAGSPRLRVISLGWDRRDDRGLRHVNAMQFALPFAAADRPSTCRRPARPSCVRAAPWTRMPTCSAGARRSFYPAIRRVRSLRRGVGRGGGADPGARRRPGAVLAVPHPVRRWPRRHAERTIARGAEPVVVLSACAGGNFGADAGARPADESRRTAASLVHRHRRDSPGVRAVLIPLTRAARSETTDRSARRDRAAQDGVDAPAAAEWAHSDWVRGRRAATAPGCETGARKPAAVLLGAVAFVLPSRALNVASCSSFARQRQRDPLPARISARAGHPPTLLARARAGRPRRRECGFTLAPSGARRHRGAVRSTKMSDQFGSARRAFAFSAAITLAAAVLFGLAPAFHARATSAGDDPGRRLHLRPPRAAHGRGAHDGATGALALLFTGAAALPC